MNKPIFKNSPNQNNEQSKRNLDVNAVEVSSEDISRVAYEKFIERGRADGRDVDDWLAAEVDLKSLRETGQKSESGAPREAQHADN